MLSHKNMKSEMVNYIVVDSGAFEWTMTIQTMLSYILETWEEICQRVSVLIGKRLTLIH